MADPGYIVNGVLTDPESWVPIAHASLSLPAATVTWTSTNDGQVGDFSQYMDLIMVAYAHSDNGATAIRYMHMNFNNSSGSRHSVQWYSGDGSSVVLSGSGPSTAALPIGVVLTDASGSTEFATTVAHLFDINSGKYKVGISQSAGDSNGDGEVLVNALVWTDQAPITEIDVTTYGDNFEAGSVFSLFGILSRMGPPAATVTVTT